jgi:hypothetical protein
MLAAQMRVQDQMRNIHTERGEINKITYVIYIYVYTYIHTYIHIIYIYIYIYIYIPSSAVVYAQGRESGDSGFETRSGGIPRRRSCSAAITPWLINNKLAGESPSLYIYTICTTCTRCNTYICYIFTYYTSTRWRPGCGCRTR